ncbi:hypothetical protein [Sphingomonas sp. Leaf25]|uniref:hypothetical protein n=1 Tax=Sphingomonas sp. Leaf25 TaxID=1735692 RepID=UPI0006F5064C|nr:hypothetical protein [Sphingomonas sp. Leaf25]KQN00084.1 hypothetical protein ASE78_17600 [Sphingomonas sp. Leaf25]
MFPNFGRSFIGAIDALFTAFDRSLCERGYLPMGGHIVDATLVAAPKQRNTATEREAIQAGRSAAEIWPDEPAKAAQKDTNARWTLRFAKARTLPDGPPGVGIARVGVKVGLANLAYNIDRLIFHERRAAMG